MTSARNDEVRIHIDAPSEVVWDLLANLERMGEWSPECHRVRWLNGATSPAEAGAKFKGFNRSGLLRWSMTCEVKVANRGSELAWSTIRRGQEVVRWTYQLQPADSGTDVVESFRALSWPPYVRFFEDFVMRNRDERRRAAMRTTLQRIKAAVEASASVQ